MSKAIRCFYCAVKFKGQPEQAKEQGWAVAVPAIKEATESTAYKIIATGVTTLDVCPKCSMDRKKEAMDDLVRRKK